jgi:hypothetical protein
MKYKDYKIITSYSEYNLISMVNEALRDGYTLIGGVAMNSNVLMQAVAKIVHDEHVNTGPK